MITSDVSPPTLPAPPTPRPCPGLVSLEGNPVDFIQTDGLREEAVASHDEITAIYQNSVSSHGRFKPNGTCA
ncbi:hypothetical protein CgunFtcFv8_020170 [Champsocephalus gunnari]|uniref:Uncharacterized protein n=1 Tax=Champsocephalus gunnari TaxID=52237 RepID=A0AAN8DIS5_CHAGU|nr:hypothetical protein CgunFtcFv8_020170 [Champsocephalus gunnari]